ncbi:type II secretion system protein M [Vibrio sonorensis]|uniref:type II secretion system protein M n=1 Tax=Vibrio sonorensis TaxID=1004316 RepID=UPI0008D8FE91|nr:type II secretion system protein M [Vibrio sonorensis]
MKALKEQFLSWWLGLTMRERNLLTAGGVVLLVSSLYWGIVAPLQERAQQAETQLQAEKRLLTWVSESAQRISSLRATSGAPVATKPLNQLIPESTRRFHIDLIRIQPRGEEFQVWVKATPFNQFVDWITYLEEQHGVQVVFMDLVRTERDGMVEVKRLQLSQG